MKYKTQFRLAVQAVALFTFILTSFLPILIVSGAIYTLSTSTMSRVRWWEYPLFASLLLPSLLSAYVFFKPNFIVNLAIPSNKPYCPECGYQLAKPIPNHCSECGTALPNNLLNEINKTKPNPPSDSNS